MALGAFTVPAHPAAALRERLAPSEDDLRALGAETALAALPDDLLITAARAGATMSMTFLDILDGGCFVPAPCLCCYAAHSAGSAREAATALRLYLQYYEPASYVGSRAYVRAVAAMARDLEPEELAELKEGLARLNSTPELAREANSSLSGLCVAVPPCQPEVLWVYSTPAGRRLLRHLARKRAPHGGAAAPVRVTVASSDLAATPRYRYRMYAAASLAEQAEGAAGGTHRLLEEAASWARAEAAGGQKRAPKKAQRAPRVSGGNC
jgi:hypothetical protein